MSGRERVALGACTGRVQLQQLLGEVGDGPRDPLLGPEPLRAAEPGQRRPLPAGIARDPRDLLDGDEDPVAASERELEVVAVLAGAAAPQHLLVARDAVVDVDDEVAGRQALQDVARHDAPERPRTADADGPEQLAVRDERQPVRAACEAAVEAAVDERDGTRAAGRSRCRLRTATGWPASSSRSARRSGLIRGEDDPLAVRAPALDRVDDARRPTEREGGLPPAEEVARRQRAAGHRAALGRLGLPGQLERPRPDEPALPVARRQVGRRPVLRGDRPTRPAPSRRSSAWRHRNSAASAMSPGSSRTTSVPGSRWSRPVAGASWAAQTSAASPTVMARVSPAVSDRPQVVGGTLEPRQVRGQAFGQPGGGPAESLADRGRAAGRQQELGRGKEDGTRRRSGRFAGPWGRRRAANRSRRRRTRPGSAARATAGRRRRCRRAGRTRRDRRPR